MKKNKNLIKKSFNLHRKIGVLCSIPIILIALSGIFLNHASFFSLNKIYIKNSALLSFYKMQPKERPKGFKPSKSWISSFEGGLFLDETKLSDINSEIVSAVKLNDMIAAANKNYLFIIDTKEKFIVEKLGRESLPKGEIKRLAVKNKILLIETDKDLFETSFKISKFKKAKKQEIEVPKKLFLPEKLEEKILQNFRGEGISLSKIMLDIHTGAMFGVSGRFVWDLFAVCLLLLVGTGLYQRRG